MRIWLYLICVSCILYLSDAGSSKNKKALKKETVSAREESENIDAILSDLRDFRKEYDIKSIAKVPLSDYQNILSQAFNEAESIYKYIDTERALYLHSPDMFADLCYGMVPQPEHEGKSIVESLLSYSEVYEKYFLLKRNQKLTQEEYRFLYNQTANLHRAMQSLRFHTQMAQCAELMRWKYMETTFERERWLFYAQSLKALVERGEKSEELFELIANLFRHVFYILVSLKGALETFHGTTNLFMTKMGWLGQMIIIDRTRDYSSDPGRAHIRNQFHTIYQDFKCLYNMQPVANELVEMVITLDMFAPHAVLESKLNKFFELCQNFVDSAKPDSAQNLDTTQIVEISKAIKLWLHLSPLIPRDSKFKGKLREALGCLRDDPVVFVDTLFLGIPPVSIETILGFGREKSREIWHHFTTYVNLTDAHIGYCRSEYASLLPAHRNITLLNDESLPLVEIIDEVIDHEVSNGPFERSESVARTPPIKSAAVPVQEKNICDRLLSGEKGHRKFVLVRMVDNRHESILDSQQMLTFCKIEQGTLRSGIATLKWNEIESLISKGLHGKISAKYGSVTEIHLPFSERQCSFIIHKPHSGRFSRDNSVGLGFVVRMRNAFRNCDLVLDHYSVQRL